MNFKYKNALTLSRFIFKDSIKEGDRVIDATCGNGHDSLFLSQIIGESGKLYCFDIQDIAINNTKIRLKENSPYENYTLIKDGHENLDLYIKEEIQGVVFNLGYLPGGNHKIITSPMSTITSLQKTLKLLSPGGIAVIVVYYGHEGGDYEKDALYKFIGSINPKLFTVISSQFVNQINNPPLLIVIEKVRDMSYEDK
ncbi:ribosomal RNA small subunit methyltransferase H [Oxobacter pfennigii]|uniref:Ribosomal RNA small subunit methyltransferase H n=1 Tax=Oxobacter pfennigii TaxID=36849 RepID=A0A0N8NTH7_9CLOT|nr:class I SAM-dependent methyltransferase [Oxobacter pfennigii]KPU44864.1 ribosomal RNA small subunit methyltransferase H [Oxobacter pfennigii]